MQIDSIEHPCAYKEMFLKQPFIPPEPVTRLD